MPNGCKSIFITRSLHISYITELFGLGVLVFLGKSKKKQKNERKKGGGAIKGIIEVTFFFC